MQNMLSVKRFNPMEMAEQKAIQVQINKMNIGAEMYIVQSSSLYYVDIMSDVDSETQASSRSVGAWLNDSIRKGTIVREGLINMYKKDNKKQFVNGMWQSCYFPDYISYLLHHLTDKKYTKAKASLYVKSSADKNWLNQFIAMAGIKILESQIKIGLHSKVAQIIITQNIQTRELLSKMSSSGGRVSMNAHNKYGNDAAAEAKHFKAIIEDYLKKQHENITSQILLRKEEHDLLLEYEKYYDVALSQIQQELLAIC